MNKKYIMIIAMVALVAVLAPVVGVSAITVGTVNGLNGNLTGLLGGIITKIIGIIGLIAVVFLIWGGVQYTTSAGDEGQLEKAKTTMTYAIMGLIVAGISYAAVTFILSMF